MNPLQALIEKLRGQMKQIAARANELLSSKPPLEQFEKTSPIYSALLSMGYALDYMSDTALNIGRELDALDPQKAIEEGATEILRKKLESGELLKKEDLEAKLTAGEFVKKTDAETAATTAADAREKLVRAEIALVETRRVEVTTDKSDTEKALVPAALASKIPADALKGDDYLTKVGVIAARLKSMKAIGVESTELLNSAAETPLDEAGQKAFTDRLTWMGEIKTKAGGGGGHVPNPLQPGGGSGGGAVELCGI